MSNRVNKLAICWFIGVDLSGRDSVASHRDSTFIFIVVGNDCAYQAPAKSGADCVRILRSSGNYVFWFNRLNAVVANKNTNFEVFAIGWNLVCDWPKVLPSLCQFWPWNLLSSYRNLLSWIRFLKWNLRNLVITRDNESLNLSSTDVLYSEHRPELQY